MNSKFFAFILMCVVMFYMSSAYAVGQANKLYGSSLWGMSIDQVIIAEKFKDPFVFRTLDKQYSLSDREPMIGELNRNIHIGRHEFSYSYVFDSKSMKLLKVELSSETINFLNHEHRDNDILEYIFSHVEHEISINFGKADRVTSEPFKRVDGIKVNNIKYGWTEESESVWNSGDTKITLKAKKTEYFGAILSITYEKR